MVAKNKQDQYLVTNLIHALRFNTFLFFLAFMYCSFISKVQIVSK